MEKNISKISLILLTVLLVAGCGPKSTPEPTSIPLPTLTSTPRPTATDAPTPTLLPTPTDQVSCTDSAEFVTDVTVPDNTAFGAGQAFVKTWRFKNTGTCTWNMRYNLVYLRGEQMGAEARVSFGEPETEPGQTADISINLVAPAQNGTYTGTFQFEDPSGKRFGVKDGNFWVRIVVDSGGAGTTPVAGNTPTASGTAGTCVFGLNADYVSQVLNLINQARVSNGLSALTVNPALTAAAQAHSQDMACNSFINHRGSDGSTKASRIAAQGYVSSRDDEVIYAAFPDGGGDPASVVNWWLNDANHRPVLLAADFTEFGAGYAFVSTSGAGGYFTINFAVP